MATYQITIDEKNIGGKKFLDFMQTLPFVSINKNSASKKKNLSSMDKAMEDIKKGRLHTAKNTDDLMKQINY